MSGGESREFESCPGGGGVRHFYMSFVLSRGVNVAGKVGALRRGYALGLEGFEK